jgi:hypothetical protein
VQPPTRQPPDGVSFDPEEALYLLAAFEDSRDVLIDTDDFSVLAQVEDQIQILSRKLGLDQGGPDVH